jgi:hypothetical protein
VKKPDVEVLGWRGYKWFAVVRPVGRTAKFSKMTLGVAYGREINITLSGNSSGVHSCSDDANYTLPKKCDKAAHFRGPFIVPSTRCTCVMIMLV